ncbi:LytR C-terminal domain-containing protein [Kribbella sp. NPDC050241]|uniref:LytR C-terminal domain-containing protein n=1 Tax=Kribbella sp. NPDC050241 TaxID=3364115 RepID=UPI0037AE4956
MSRPTDERGQVLSSLVAVLAVVAIVAGLLVLFGTRGGDSTADQPSSATSPKPSTKPTTGPSTIVASVPKPGESETPVPPTTEPTGAPTQEPTPEPTQPPSSESTTAPPAIPPDERPAVEVYNNTGRKGLADSVAGRARQAGWTVAGADNWHGKIAESTVYYPPGMLDAANQLARDLGVSRTKGALDNMKKDRLTVILTSDYTG